MKILFFTGALLIPLLSAAAADSPKTVLKKFNAAVKADKVETLKGNVCSEDFWFGIATSCSQAGRAFKMDKVSFKARGKASIKADRAILRVWRYRGREKSTKYDTAYFFFERIAGNWQIAQIYMRRNKSKDPKKFLTGKIGARLEVKHPLTEQETVNLQALRKTVKDFQTNFNAEKMTALQALGNEKFWKWNGNFVEKYAVKEKRRIKHTFSRIWGNMGIATLEIHSADGGFKSMWMALEYDGGWKVIQILSRRDLAIKHLTGKSAD